MLCPILSEDRARLYTHRENTLLANSWKPTIATCILKFGKFTYFKLVSQCFPEIVCRTHRKSIWPLLCIYVPRSPDMNWRDKYKKSHDALFMTSVEPTKQKLRTFIASYIYGSQCTSVYI